MSNIRAYVNSVMGGANDAVGHGTEAAIATATGLGLGLVAGQRKGGLDTESDIPLDLAAGAGGILLSMFAPIPAAYKGILRNGSQHALAIGVFRKAAKWSSDSSTPAVAGEFGEDPIVKAARLL